MSKIEAVLHFGRVGQGPAQGLAEGCDDIAVMLCDEMAASRERGQQDM
jgi:hypothetical protein